MRSSWIPKRPPWLSGDWIRDRENRRRLIPDHPGFPITQDSRSPRILDPDPIFPARNIEAISGEGGPGEKKEVARSGRSRRGRGRGPRDPRPWGGRGKGGDFGDHGNDAEVSCPLHVDRRSVGSDGTGGEIRESEGVGLEGRIASRNVPLPCALPRRGARLPRPDGVLRGSCRRGRRPGGGAMAEISSVLRRVFEAGSGRKA